MAKIKCLDIFTRYFDHNRITILLWVQLKLNTYSKGCTNCSFFFFLTDRQQHSQSQHYIKKNN